MSGQLDVPYPSISDYAVIGDCRSAALVSKAGSIDWLCWPRFDSPSVFAALLDARRGGRFAVAPAGAFTAVRRYVGDTAVIETTFTTATGVARLTDLMPVMTEAEKARELSPDHELLRRVECVSGMVEIDVLFDPRPDYARVTPRLLETSDGGLLCEHRSQVIALRSEIPLTTGAGPGAQGRVRLQTGETRMLSLTFDRGLPAVRAPVGARAADRIARSLSWWNEWMRSCVYEGPYEEAVCRSAITLKLLTYAPSGAMVAAPTTSLPEAIGGVRNWDYRYCWLRDASLTLRALDDLGFGTEGEAFLSWILHATRLTWPDLQVLYDVYGEAQLPESTLDHLEGYAGSAPVRIGNDAAGQVQLDTYGEVIDAAWRYVERGGRLDRTTARVIAGLGETVVRRWREPDEGIWEPRSGRRHHTHSKALCWVALDRLARLCERQVVRTDAARFARACDEIRNAIETRGYNDRLGSYVSTFDGDTVDASLLLLPLVGYADAKSARMQGTLARLRARLGVDGLMYRYLDENDGLPGTEGAFGICSFWAVETCALQDDLETARREFEHVLTFANDVGLFAEEIDPRTGEALGNFPQAFTHVGLINAAVAIARLQGQASRPASMGAAAGEALGPYEPAEHPALGICRHRRPLRDHGGRTGPRVHPHERSVPAGDDADAQPRSGDAAGPARAHDGRMAVRAAVRPGVRELARRDVVARRRHRARARPLRPDGGHACRSCHASPHGQRVLRPGDQPTLAAAGISGAQLRAPHPVRRAALTSRLRRDPGRVLSTGAAVASGAASRPPLSGSGES